MRAEGHHPLSCTTGGEALDVLDREEVDLVLLDLMLPDMRGQDVLREIRDRDPDQVVIVITAYGSVRKAMEATKGAGAFHALEKPFDPDEVLAWHREGVPAPEIFERTYPVEAQG